jgi:1-acyl-sn-glycerol-3-phosphate acyltransferase
MIRHAYKILSFLVFIGIYLLSSKCISTFSLNEAQKRRHLIFNTSRFSRILLHLLGIAVSVKAEKEMPSSGRGLLILANHLSYIDIVIISAFLPAVFVTSYEIRDSPVEGLLARCAGSVFVNRRSTATLRTDIRALAGLLKQGLAVVLFPEATSSSGENVLPFKSALLNAALDAGSNILPVCINYSSIDGDIITALNRDKIFYYGDMQFLDHFLGLLKLHTVNLELVFLESVPAEVSKRKSVAKLAFECISKAYVGVR